MRNYIADANKVNILNKDSPALNMKMRTVLQYLSCKQKVRLT